SPSGLLGRDRARYPEPDTHPAPDPDPGPDPDPDPPPHPDPDPDPDPDEPDPWDIHERLARSLGARVAAFVGHPDNPDVVATAEAQVPIVAEYVRGFTREIGRASCRERV